MIPAKTVKPGTRIVMRGAFALALALKADHSGGADHGHKH